MCGILGAHGERTNLNEYLDLIKHRGPDGNDLVHQYSSTLGHTRLAIVDVDHGQQPMRSPDGRLCLIANGEIYNQRTLRNDHPDYEYLTDSDSEVILSLYEQYGNDCVHYLDGMFAFALVDGEDLLLARDPLGIKPLYYGWKHNTLYFGSEIKALQHMVDDVKEFPPGHWYSTQEGLVRYYDIVSVAESAAKLQNPRPGLTEIRETLRRAVEKRLMSDVPLGVFLSGGLDSSIIAALVAEAVPGRVHSFAVGFADSEDLAHARDVAKYIGTEHHEAVITVEDVVDAVPRVIYYLETFDPSLVRSAIPNYFLSELARKYVTVVLSGEGADELFAGYAYFKDLNVEDLHEELAHATRELHSCNLLRCDRMSMAHGLEARVPFLDTAFMHTAFSVPVDQKIYGEKSIEKWALRKAFEDMIPDSVAWRVKQQFSKGAGSAYVIEKIAENQITDAEFHAEREKIRVTNGYEIRSKEELYYYRVFRQHFHIPVTGLVQRWRGHIEGKPL